MASSAGGAPPELETGRSHTVIASSLRRPAYGPQLALVTIEHFGAFNEVASAALARSLRRVQQRRPNDVRLVFRHLVPRHRRRFGGVARLAALAAEEAHAQGKFWQFHDLLFEESQGLKEDRVFWIAAQAGLDVARVRRSVDQRKHERLLDEDESRARARGLTKLGALINGEPVFGAPPVELLVAKVDAALVQARKSARAGESYARLYEGRSQPKKEKSDLPAAPVLRHRIRTAGAPSRGPATARIVIVEFAGLGSSRNTNAAQVIGRMRREFPNKIRHVFKHLPKGKSGLDLHRIGVEAERGGSFWELYDHLVSNRGTRLSGVGRPSEHTVKILAEAAKLEPAVVRSVLDSNRHAEVVEDDMREGRKLALATNGLYVNGRRLTGTPNEDALRALIEEELEGGLLSRLPAP